MTDETIPLGEALAIIDDAADLSRLTQEHLRSQLRHAASGGRGCECDRLEARIDDLEDRLHALEDAPDDGGPDEAIEPDPVTRHPMICAPGRDRFERADGVAAAADGDPEPGPLHDDGWLQEHVPSHVTWALDEPEHHPECDRLWITPFSADPVGQRACPTCQALEADDGRPVRVLEQMFAPTGWRAVSP